MKTLRLALPFLTAVLFLTLPLQAQENSKQQEEKLEQKADSKRHPTQLKVQVVFTEFDGDKKSRSMPYTSIFAADPSDHPDAMRLRIGSRVPLWVGKDSGFQYVDVGTNLDCTAERLDDGRFSLRLALERSWIQGDLALDQSSPAQPAASTLPPLKEPVIGQYKISQLLVMRDGQTLETTVATDPLNGKQLRIELTLNVLK
jgi:hypothetical protein